MIPENILRYLNREQVSFTRRWHPRAISGQELAHSLHISGRRVSKCVVVEADGIKTLAVLSVASAVDLPLLAQGLHRSRVIAIPEHEFAGLFPNCELGAEPPLGRLYQLPVVVDALYAQGSEIIFRAGSHEETVEMSFHDYELLETPRIVPFAKPLPVRAPRPLEEARA